MDPIVYLSVSISIESTRREPWMDIGSEWTVWGQLFSFLCLLLVVLSKLMVRRFVTTGAVEDRRDRLQDRPKRSKKEKKNTQERGLNIREGKRETTIDSAISDG